MTSHQKWEKVNGVLSILPQIWMLLILILPILFCPERSAFYACCMYSSAPRLDFIMEANTMNPWEQSEQSDLGPYCLQCRLP